MLVSETAFKSATELAAMIREQEITSQALVEHYLERINRYNPKINAVVTLDAEGARTRAKAADDALAEGRLLGPLHGVPVTIKDGFETAGMRTTSGADSFKDHIPKDNAAAVQRYVDAGAIILGKTNVPPFCADAQSFNDLFGTTNNPWDLSRTPGGSSGGAVAAMAAGLTALELGSDIAGSIRVPAVWSGVYGHRPSYGIVPFRGHIPPPPGILSQSDLAVAGPIARSAADLALALDILAGPSQLEEKAWRLNLPKPRATSLKDFRIAAWLDSASVPMDSAVNECLVSTVAALRSAGATVDEQARPAIDFEQSNRTYFQLLNPILATGLSFETFEMLKQLAKSDQKQTLMGEFAKDATQMHRQWLSANAKRHKQRQAWHDFFQNYDVLICPAVSVPAIAHNSKGSTYERHVIVNGKREPYDILLRWAGFVTHVYLPATSAPIGKTRSGLPMGIQIVGPYLEDYTTIAFADELSKLLGGFEPPPDFI